jgi:hypothetical protein
MNYKTLTGQTIAIAIVVIAASNAILANKMTTAFKEAFNDPAIIAYANEQERTCPTCRRH